MSNLDIVWQGSPNHWKGRNGYKIMGICNHVMQGYKWGTKSHFQNAASQSSTHYAVHWDGSVWQYVRDEDTAWGNGVVNLPDTTVPLIKYCVDNGINPNYTFISIEHEGLTGQTFTTAQIASSIALQKMLIAKYNIDRKNIVGHFQIDKINRPNCPGSTFFWPKLLASVVDEVGATIKEPVKIANSWQDFVTGYYVVEPFSSEIMNIDKGLNTVGYTALDVLGRPISGMTMKGDILVQNFERARIEKHNGIIKPMFGLVNSELLAK